MLSTILKITLTGLGLLKTLLDWWRKKSIEDVAIKAERARVAEAEKKAHAEMETIKRDSRDDVVRRLRDHEF